MSLRMPRLKVTALVLGLRLFSCVALGNEDSFLGRRVNTTALVSADRAKACSTGKPTGFTASGCWKTTSVKDRIDYEGVRKMSPDECFGFCAEKKGMQFFGTWKGEKCWCATLHDGAKSEGGSACDYPCTGAKDKMCGGIEAANVYVMYDCTPPTEEEKKAKAAKDRKDIMDGYASFEGQTCGGAEGNKLKVSQPDSVELSDTQVGSVEDCKMACHNSMQCHGFTYEEGMQKCSFKYDVTDGEVKKGNKIKCYWKKLGLVQKTAPDMAEEVKREANENIEIHDVFASQEKESKEKDRKVKSDRSLKAFIQLSKSAPDMAEEVKKEFAQNIQIHDVFSAEEKDDVKKEKAVKANKELSALQTAPDMAEEVKRESNENIQIHDTFAAQEKDSKEKERKVKGE